MSLFGGDNGAVAAQREALASQQRRTLAELARTKGEADQATASSGGTGQIGGKLLTFLKLNTGSQPLG